MVRYPKQAKTMVVMAVGQPLQPPKEGFSTIESRAPDEARAAAT